MGKSLGVAASRKFGHFLPSHGISKSVCVIDHILCYGGESLNSFGLKSPHLQNDESDFYG